MDTHPSDEAYKGTVPYEERDGFYFCGRDDDCKLITANLIGSRLTILYGPSGVGKSSVLNAGIAYHVNQVLAKESREEGRQPKFAVVVFRSWSDDPIPGLLIEARKAVEGILNRELTDLRLMSSLNDLSGIRHTLANALGDMAKEFGGMLLLVLDQFEQYFDPDESGPGRIDDEFIELLQRPNFPVHVLISIRQDALAKLDRLQSRIPNLYENLFRLKPLNREAVTEAIRKPIDKFNEKYKLKGERRYSIDRNLLKSLRFDLIRREKYEKEKWVKGVSDIVNNASVSVSRGGVDLKEVLNEAADLTSNLTRNLQKVMRKLWNEEKKADGSRTLQQVTLNKLGGVSDIVAERRRCTLPEIASWEGGFSGLKLFWVILPDFVGFRPEFFEAMMGNMASKKIEYVYVLKSETELQELGKLYLKLSDALKEKKKNILGKIIGVIFDPKTYDKLFNGKYYWIADAFTKSGGFKSEGFQVEVINGEIVGGIELREELPNIIENLRVLYYVAKRAQPWVEVRIKASSLSKKEIRRLAKRARPVVEKESRQLD